MATAKPKPAPDAAPESGVVYICTRQVRYDNIDYQADEPIELTARHAQPLLDCGAVRLQGDGE